MTVLKLLPGMIRPEELFRMVAFSDLVHIHQVLNSNIPIAFSQSSTIAARRWFSIALKSVTAVSTSVQHP